MSPILDLAPVYCKVWSTGNQRSKSTFHIMACIQTVWIPWHNDLFKRTNHSEHKVLSHYLLRMTISLSRGCSLKTQVGAGLWEEPLSPLFWSKAVFHEPLPGLLDSIWKSSASWAGQRTDSYSRAAENSPWVVTEYVTFSQRLRCLSVFLTIMGYDTDAQLLQTLKQTGNLEDASVLTQDGKSQIKGWLSN